MTKVMKIILALAFSIILGLSAFLAAEKPNHAITASESSLTTDVVDHSLFDEILKQYVDKEGMVDYAGLKASPEKLDQYLSILDQTNPALLGDSDRLAFWLNVYNAYTLKLIINNYPIKSIRQAANGPFIPKINTPWEVDLVKVGGKVYDLDHVEHKVIRKEFDDARVHFALVCAAMSCPKLRLESYRGDILDQQLHDQGVDFLNSNNKNRIEKDGTQIRVSKIFKWFKGDFAKDGRTLQQFVAEFYEGELAEALSQNKLKVKYTSYDWSLNDRSKRS